MNERFVKGETIMEERAEGMTDEAMADKYAFETRESCMYDDRIGWETDHIARKQAFLAGLKAGSQLDKVWHDYDAGEDCYEDSHEGKWVKREAGKPKWHKVADGDLPKDEDYKWCISSNGVYYVARYEELFVSWTNQEHKEVCCPIAWCEIPQYTEG